VTWINANSSLSAHRELLEQAKSMLMAVYDISAEAAFSILKWRSQQLNVKLHDVAAKLVADLPSYSRAISRLAHRSTTT
jgi:AmiR/NasT family two-component response regulator